MAQGSSLPATEGRKLLQYDIGRRAFDGRFVLWKRHEDPELASGWQAVGVFKSFRLALEQIRCLTAKRKPL